MRPVIMKPDIAADFLARVRYEEPLSLHTSWHAGGAAQVWFTPRDVGDLAAFLSALPNEVPVYWIGLGSNLLVRDGGIRGVVIATPGAFTRIERRSQTRLYCQASVPCARIARYCVKIGLSQGEFFSGIPGTLGGALAMNAGAFGDETWRHVLGVETIESARPPLRARRRGVSGRLSLGRAAQERRAGVVSWPPNCNSIRARSHQRIRSRR